MRSQIQQEQIEVDQHIPVFSLDSLPYVIRILRGTHVVCSKSSLASSFEEINDRIDRGVFLSVPANKLLSHFLVLAYIRYINFESQI